MLKPRNRHIYFFLVTIILLLFGCRIDEQIPQQDPCLWYKNLNTPQNKPADIFYIIPTCVLDYKNYNGDIMHFADPYNSEQRAMMKPSFELGEEIFGGSANFYAPYYKQITLESWINDSIINERFPYAFTDLAKSFDYYINHINNGRPFILAGFSQGGKCVVELLKILTKEQYERLIAAYVIGYRVAASDTTHWQITPALADSDTGVTISYNSVSSPNSISQFLSPTSICINPINWKVTPETAKLNDTTTVKIDPNTNMLLIEGLDQMKYYTPELDYLFKPGNYHLYELTFYSKFLSENVKQRINSFIK